MKAMPQLHALVGRPACPRRRHRGGDPRHDSRESRAATGRSSGSADRYWDTAPIPITKLQATLAAHGYTTPSINKLFHNQAVLNHIKKSIKYEIQFYRETDYTVPDCPILGSNHRAEAARLEV